MLFKELIENPSKENKIRFKQKCIKRIEQEIEINGDRWGIKNRQIDMLMEDIRELENEDKRTFETQNKQ